MMFYKETEYRDTEIGRIPKEWEVAQLGSENVSILIKSGSTPLKKVKEYWNGNIPFVTQSDMTKVDRYLHETSEKITDLGLKNSNLLLIPEDSVLLSMYGTIGKVVINKTPVAISQNIAAIILNKKNVNHEYLFYVVQKYSFQLKRRAKIITLKHLDIQIIKNMLLPFPSLQEQQKIAEILSTVDKAIQKTDDIIAKTERLKKGLMQELLTKGIGHKEFKDTEIGEIPKEWEAIRFGDIVNLVKGRRPKEFVNERIKDSLPYLSAENLRNNNAVQFVKVSDDIILVDDGDLILIWDGSNAGEFFLGKRGVLSSTMVKILLKKKLYDSKFLFYLLKTKENYLKDQTKGTGIPHVDEAILRSLVIPLPPSEEQQKIAEILSTVDEAIQKTDEVIAKTGRLKKGLMQELLTRGIGHKEFKDTEIGRKPKEWEVKKLGEFLHLKNGKRPNIVANGKFPVYGANGIMGYTDAYMVDDDVVIIGRVGAAGEVHLARGKIWVSDNAIYDINKNKTKIYLEFIYYVLKYANLSRFASQTTHPIITQTLLENFKVTVPPLEEQQKIASILSTVDEKLETSKLEKVKLERVKQWFMEELLTGRVRVRVA